MRAPSSCRSRGSSSFTSASVPTGMKHGVATSPCAVVSVALRALPDVRVQHEVADHARHRSRRRSIASVARYSGGGSLSNAIICFVRGCLNRKRHACSAWPGSGSRESLRP